jgi:hypothetical protein
MEDLFCTMEDMFCTMENLFCTMEDMFCTMEDMFCTIEDLFCSMEDMFCTMEDMFCTMEDMDKSGTHFAIDGVGQLNSDSIAVKFKHTSLSYMKDSIRYKRYSQLTILWAKTAQVFY